MRLIGPLCLRPSVQLIHRIRSTGNSDQPTSMPPQLGCVKVRPARPHFEQRPCRRSISGHASGPQRMIYGAIAIAA